MSDSTDDPKPDPPPPPAPTRNEVPPPPVDAKPEAPPPPPPPVAKVEEAEKKAAATSEVATPPVAGPPPSPAPGDGAGEKDDGGNAQDGGNTVVTSPFKDDKILGTFCHLLAFAGFLVWGIGNIVGPLVLWLFKKDESKVVDREGRNSINFQTLFSLAAILVAALFGVLSQIPLLGVLFVFVGGLLLSAIIIANVVCVVMAVVNLNSGKEWKYPVTYDFVGLVDRIINKPPAAS